MILYILSPFYFYYIPAFKDINFWFTFTLINFNLHKAKCFYYLARNQCTYSRSALDNYIEVSPGAHLGQHLISFFPTLINSIAARHLFSLTSCLALRHVTTLSSPQSRMLRKSLRPAPPHRHFTTLPNAHMPSLTRIHLCRCICDRILTSAQSKFPLAILKNRHEPY